MNSNSIILIIFLLLFSCNQDSNELPFPPLPIRKEIKKQILLNGKELLEVIIQPPTHLGDDPALIFIRNISGTYIGDASIIIEVCEVSQNYEKCRRYQLFEALNLKDGIRSFLGNLNGLTISDNTVFNIYLSKYNGESLALEGATGDGRNYKLDGLATFFKSNKIVAYGKSTAYIQVDGTVSIRLSSFSTADGLTKFYNVSGSIVDKRLIIGTLSTDLNPSSLVPLLPESTFLRANSLLKVKEDYQPFTSIHITHE